MDKLKRSTRRNIQTVTGVIIFFTAQLGQRVSFDIKPRSDEGFGGVSIVNAFNLDPQQIFRMSDNFYIKSLVTGFVA